MTSSGDDPVLVRRTQMRRLAEIGQRVGWACVLVAVVAFFAGVVTEDLGRWTGIVIAALVASTLTLAPAIVLGYAVKAAEREDASR